MAFENLKKQIAALQAAKKKLNLQAEKRLIDLKDVLATNEAMKKEEDLNEKMIKDFQKRNAKVFVGDQPLLPPEIEPGAEELPLIDSMSPGRTA